MTIIALDVIQNFSNFFDTVVNFLSVIYDSLVSLTTGAVDLLRMAFTFVTLGPILSNNLLAPIAISASFVVVVGVIKLILGRSS